MELFVERLKWFDACWISDFSLRITSFYSQTDEWGLIYILSCGKSNVYFNHSIYDAVIAFRQTYKDTVQDCYSCIWKTSALIPK